MSTNAPLRASVGGGNVAPAPPAHALTLRESAWLALLPCALALLAIVLLLGPPLGSLLFGPPGTSGFWPHYVREGVVLPEPTEHARYALSLLGPLLVSGGMLLLAGRQVRTALVDVLVPLSQAALLAFVASAIVYQASYVYNASYSFAHDTTAYFTPATLAVAVVLALLAGAALANEAIVARLARAAHETSAKRAVAIGAAALYLVVWMLSSFNTDATIYTAHGEVWGNIPFWIDEAAAILNGQAPLVDYHVQYGQLWAYVAAGGMALLGVSWGVYSGMALAATAGAFAAVFATFRRVAGSSLAALALFLPFVATSFFMTNGPAENRYGPASLYSLFPIRYAGPFVLLWLIARAAQRPSARRPLPLFVLAGLVAINNVEFGVPAFGATLAAMVWLEPRPTVRALAHLTGLALAGLAIAAVLVAALTLLVSGSLPDYTRLTTFPHIYGAEGFGMLMMPPFGIHLMLYCTMAATIVVATQRAASGTRDALTGTLVFAGVFGLGAGAYFVGRSHPHVLIDVFSAWALALSLLVVVAVRDLAATPRRPGLAALLVLAGFGISVCSLAQTPTPWSQLDRLSHTLPADERPFDVSVEIVDKLTRGGEPIVILLKQGHRIADRVGVVNVAPYTNLELMLSKPQWEETIAALREAGGTRLIVPRERLLDEEIEWLASVGYVPRREASGIGAIEFVERKPRP